MAEEITNEHADHATGHEHNGSSEGVCTSCNQHMEEPNGEGADVQPNEHTFQMTIKLPHEPYKTQTIVSTQDQAQDVRQSIIDLPHTYQYTCFHLERKGERIPDFVDLGDIPGVGADVELSLVEDPYTEKDARIHVLRIRDIIGANGDRTELSRGINAGLSLHDDVLASADNTPDAAAKTSEAHPMTGYDFEGPLSLDVLLPPPRDSAPKTVKSLSLSPWHPPPYHLRSKGHLLYLQVTTNEGEQHQITAAVTGFFVNKSSNSKFDPFPRITPKTFSSHSLLALISRISPSFESSFQALQEHNSKREPLSTFQPSNAIPSSPWLVSSSISTLSAHLSDIARPQENYLMGGADSSETLRDWNEEIQTLKELPKETVPDRVFRERAISKLYADYNEAATSGAVLIARGEVPPLNPTENRDAQIFVYNNIFFSFGADGVGTFTNEGGDEAARVATGKDVSGVRIINQLDIHGLSSPGTVVVDLFGKRMVAQSIVPGIFKQREPGDPQIDYGGVEGKDVVADNKAFEPVFEKVAKAMRTKKHAVWDKENKRHDLETSVETKGLLGTDGRKYALDLYRLTPLDISWIEKHWKGLPSETEPHDGYVHRMTVLRPELVDAFWRLKLRDHISKQLASKDSAKALTNGDASHKEIQDGERTETSKTENGHKDNVDDEDTEIKHDEQQDRVDIADFDYALNPDVFSGQLPQLDEEKEQWAKDEAEVRAACEHLNTEVLPRLISDLRDGEVGFPMDGQSLSSLCHKRGINIRYLGRIAELSDNDEPRLQALLGLATREMVVRAFKHVANQHMRYMPTIFAPACCAHLLNCLLGGDLNAKPKAVIDEEIRAMYSEADLSFEKMTPALLQSQIIRQIHLRFRFDLPADWFNSVKHIQLLREVSLKLGLQLGARDFVFGKRAVEPETNGHVNGNSHGNDLQPPAAAGGHVSNSSKKKKKAGDRSPSRSPTEEQTFSPEDIYNIVPVLKESSPRSVLADEALEAGRLSLAQNQRELGQELLLESLGLHEQIYGVLHAEVARVYHTLSTFFYGLEDKAIAVELARKAVIVSERTLGIDSSETLLGYLNLGLFEHASGNSRLALTYFRHAFMLSKIVYGHDHPDSVTTLNNAAVMLQSLKFFHDSRLWFEATLQVCQRFSGKSSVHTATVLFQLAQALALDHDPKLAVNRMREAYNIFNTTLGPADRNTKEAESWLEQLTQNAVSIARHAKDVQARRTRRLAPLGGPGSAGAAARVVLQRQVGQSSSEATAAVGSTSPSGAGASGITPRASPGTLDERSVEELLRYIEGGDKKPSSSSRRKTANPKRRGQHI